MRLTVLRDGYPINGLNTPLHALADALAAEGVPEQCGTRLRPVRFLARCLGKVEMIRNVVQVRGAASIVPLSWPNALRAFPYGYWREIIPWVCDCWPQNYDKWARIFRANRVRLAFISSRGSTEAMSDAARGVRTIWLPEACDPAAYDPSRPLVQRGIAVLELGRKYPPYHAAIEPGLREHGLTHVHSRADSGKLLFPDVASMHTALSDAVVSLCFPRSLTHPAEAHGLETVTLRYFESMASGCVPVGRCPGELLELFGYNPVVEADLSDPVGQLLDLYTKRNEYQPLVDRNLRRLHEAGSWAIRARAMLQTLKELGYWR
ncbi:MAG: glycosyltransferase family 1 protein [Phycisphaerales bacterium]|nr:glycosyltransferase family 1 protein [Phycisphaerales bacterium]